MSADDDSSIREKDRSPSSPQVASTSDISNANGSVTSLEEHSGSIFSSDRGASTSFEKPVSEPASINQDFDKDEDLLGEKSKFPSNGTPSPARYQPEMKYATTSRPDETDIVQPSVTGVSEITIPKDEKEDEDLEEAAMQPEADNEDSDSTVEDAKPPPLAGANVMNVVLVAAECAPWIKTGTCSGILICNLRKHFLSM